ncbi:16S rRNA (uracil(1498)-N(3))-methyltransferase [candidate division KSB1 bacterium]|nr:16S rRNA (uracil(1498)-N(3))-methyltransferase [candidate division KSB1 bacterium]
MAHLESFIVSPNQVNNNQLLISGKEYHHLSKVKRKRKGDRISVTDGAGNFYFVKIQKIHSNEAVCEILKTVRKVGEPVISIHVIQGLLKCQRMDWLIEKGTELGVSHFYPVMTEFCEAQTSDVKLKRWQRISRSAVKQCGRSVFPEIHPMQKLENLWEELPKPVWFAHPKEEIKLSNAIDIKKKIKSSNAISLLIGPEGGFSEHELNTFKDRGFIQVSLGNRRLRAETAAISMVLLALQEFGEI